MRNWPFSIAAVVFAISLGSAFAEDEAPVPNADEPTAAAAEPSEPAAADTADTSSASTDTPATDSDNK